MKSYKYGPHFPDSFDHGGESETAQRIYKVLAKAWNYRPEGLSSETRFWKDLEKGSVDYVVDVMSELEIELGLELSLDDFEKMITIGDLIEHIEGKVGETAATS